MCGCRYCIKCRLHRRCYPVGGRRPCTCHSNCPRIHTVASGKCAPHLAITHSTHSCCNRVIRSRVNTGPTDQPSSSARLIDQAKRVDDGPTDRRRTECTPDRMWSSYF
ncbi:hypothetical protein Trydic_g15214 [Trypoxylus dichotomus]